MNKENSMVDNQMSTEIGDTLKSYSSKYKQLKNLKASSRLPHLPIKLERAAVTIQRFWRQRIFLRNLALREIKQSLDSQLDLFRFENQALGQIISAYEADCQARKERLKGIAEIHLKADEEEANSVIRRLVGLTLQMEKRKIEEKDLQQLQSEKEFWKERVIELQMGKDQLQTLITQQLQEEEAEFMKIIKEENLNLLRATKQRGELEKQLREYLVEACREETFV